MFIYDTKKLAYSLYFDDTDTDNTDAENTDTEKTDKTPEDKEKERLERLIFTVAMVVNVSDDSFATTSGIASKMKMQPMVNLAARDWRLDQASLKRLWRLVFSNPVNSFDADAWRDIKLVNIAHRKSDGAAGFKY